MNTCVEIDHIKTQLTNDERQYCPLDVRWQRASNFSGIHAWDWLRRDNYQNCEEAADIISLARTI